MLHTSIVRPLFSKWFSKWFSSGFTTFFPWIQRSSGWSFWDLLGVSCVHARHARVHTTGGVGARPTGGSRGDGRHAGCNPSTFPLDRRGSASLMASISVAKSKWETRSHSRCERGRCSSSGTVPRDGRRAVCHHSTFPWARRGAASLLASRRCCGSLTWRNLGGGKSSFSGGRAAAFGWRSCRSGPCGQPRTAAPSSSMHGTGWTWACRC